MNTISKIMTAAGCGAMMWSVSALASPAIGNWDGMGDAGNVSPTWTVVEDVGAPGSMSGAGDGLVLNLTLTGNGTFPTYGTVTTADSAFTGPYTTLGSGTTITFDLKPLSGGGSSGQVAGGLSLYFHTVNYGDWMFDFGASGANQLGNMTHFTANMGTLNGYWFSTTYGSPTQQNFVDAQADMINNGAFIGLLITGATSGTDKYAFDNFKIEGGAVPEPETVWMMVMVLGSLAVTFRSRIKDVLSTIKI